MRQKASLKLCARAGCPVMSKCDSATKRKLTCIEGGEHMGRLGCNCGAIMSSVNCPSENRIHVFSDSEVINALGTDRTKKLWDFYIVDRAYEYWYCTTCRRVHQIKVDSGVCVLRYKPIGKSDDQLGILGVSPDWRELYVITDVELDEAIERDFDTKLAEYLPRVRRRVMLSPDQQTAIVFDSITGIEVDRYVTESGNP